MKAKVHGLMIRDLELMKDITPLFEKKIIIWGMGRKGKALLTELREMGAAKRGIYLCDSDSNVQGKCIDGNVIYTPKQVHELVLADRDREMVLCIAIEDVDAQDEVLTMLEETCLAALPVYTQYAIEWGIYLNAGNPYIEPAYRSKLLVEREKRRLTHQEYQVSDTIKYFAYAPLHNDEIILIYQPGKVGSSSLYESLKRRGKYVLHCHVLTGMEYGEDNLCKLLSQKKVRIISLVREPVARQISVMWQNIVSVNRYSERVDFQEIEHYYFKEGFENDEFEWFPWQIENVFGIDIYEYPFDKEKGYGIIRSGNIEILLMKAERLSGLEEVIGSFLDMPEFVLENANVSQKKLYRFAYQDFLNGFSLSEERLKNIYFENRYIRFFYTGSERETFYQRWMHNGDEKRIDSMEQNKYLYTVDEIDLIFKEEEKIAIYGAGDYGKTLADHAVVTRGYNKKILSFLVSEKKDTDYDYRGIAVSDAYEFMAGQECFVIVAVSDRYREAVVETVERCGRRFCCLTEEGYKALLKDLEVPYHGLDFLLAGFMKCATSSLYEALRTVGDIFLPVGKETAFYKWYGKVDDFHAVLAEKHYHNVRKGQIVGAIEPGISEWGEAQLIYDNFGPELKLLFLLRNPVEAAFSDFKMAVRNGEEYCDKAHRGYQYFSMDMFDAFIDNPEEYDGFNYICWINECARYYPSEQIKIVLFEELLKDTNKVMDDILQFIGSGYQYHFHAFPHRNKGDFVPADKEGWERGREYYESSMYIKSNPMANRKRDYIPRNKRFDGVKKLYNPQMSQEQRRKLEVYYNDSVRALERFMGRSLSEVWF